MKVFLNYYLYNLEMEYYLVQDNKDVFFNVSTYMCSVCMYNEDYQ